MKCLLCESDVELLHIGKTPIAGYVVDGAEESIAQPSFDLDMMFCPSCSFVRYVEILEANLLMEDLYKKQQATYSLTAKNIEYINDFVKSAIDKHSISKSSFVMEIGCNDGSMLTAFNMTLGCSVLGIEPSKCFGDIWNKHKLEVINEFFSESTLKKIGDKKADLIIIRHVLEHIFNLNGFMSNLSKAVHDQTILMVEVPYLKTVIEKKRIDNISYPHINCFSVRSFAKLIEKFGLKIQEYRLVDTDGGSIVFTVTKSSLKNEVPLDDITVEGILLLQNYIQERKMRIAELISKYNVDEIVGYGAGAKGQHLFNLLGLERYIQTVVDDMPSYQGRFIPGTRVEINKPAHALSSAKIKAVVNLATTHGEAVRGRVPQHLEFIDVLYS